MLHASGAQGVGDLLQILSLNSVLICPEREMGLRCGFLLIGCQIGDAGEQLVVQLGGRRGVQHDGQAENAVHKIFIGAEHRFTVDVEVHLVHVPTAQ